MTVVKDPVASTDAQRSAVDASTYVTPTQVQLACRNGYKGSTTGFAPGYVQANIISVPKEYTKDVLLYAQRNPKPCPLIELIEDGKVSGKYFKGDIRTDLPGYRVYKDGQVVEDYVDNVKDYWNGELSTFLFGCSFSFESYLMKEGIKMHHIDAGRNVPMYVTNIACEPTDKLKGHMVVSLRSIPPNQISLAANVTSHFIRTHGSPIHVGDPQEIGIADVNKNDFGDAPIIPEGEIPVFWACGVTPQIAILESKVPFAISHYPGMMALLDMKDEELMNW